MPSLRGVSGILTWSPGHPYVESRASLRGVVGILPWSRWHPYVEAMASSHEVAGTLPWSRRHTSMEAVAPYRGGNATLIWRPRHLLMEARAYPHGGNARASTASRMAFFHWFISLSNDVVHFRRMVTPPFCKSLPCESCKTHQYTPSGNRPPSNCWCSPIIS